MACSPLQTAYRNLNSSHFVLFVDETFNNPKEDFELSFYMVCGVLIPQDVLDGTRDDIRGIVGENYWHTTDALQTEKGREKATELLAYCDRMGDRHIFSHKMNLTDSTKENNDIMSQAREACLTSLFQFTQSVQQDMRLIVMEKRQNLRDDDADRSVVKKLRSSGTLSRHTSVYHASPTQEQLLWLPDLSAMALRRSVTHRDETSRYFDQFLKKHSVTIDVNDPAGQQLDGI